MPSKISHPIIRNNFRFSYELPQDLVFKIAETTDEIEQAFSIIHDGFVASKLMDENASRLRITKYYCLPTTTLLICKHQEEVIATISLIGDSAFGLPTEEFRGLDEFRSKSMKLAEISGLAVKKNNQAKRGKLLLPLFKYMYEYATKCMKADALVISTTAEVKNFYRALFFFEPLDHDKVIKFSSVKNRKTVSQVLILNTLVKNLSDAYAHLPRERDLHHYYVNHKIPQFRFPKKKYYFTVDPIFSPEQMKLFFKEKSRVLETLNEKEKCFLAQFYYLADYKEAIVGQQVSSLFQGHRTSVRTPVSCLAKVTSSVNHEVKFAEVRDVSLTGLKILSMELEPRINETFEFNIEIGKLKTAKVSALVVWVKGKTAGLKVLEASHHWSEMINDAQLLYQKTGQLEVA